MPTDAPLVRSGAERATVQAAVVADSRELRVELEIVPGPGQPRQAERLGGTRPRDVLGALRSVLFAPEDLAIVRGDPGERRRFLDDLLVARAPRLAGVRADYDRVLKQRAALLKSAGAARRAGSADLRTLDVWDGHLAAAGAELLAARLAAVAALRPHAVAAYAQVAPASAELDLRYESAVAAARGETRVTTRTASTTHRRAGGRPDRRAVPVLEAALLAELARMRSAELERGVNLVGPHRDDLTLRLGELPVRGYASHGEAWSVALALRLGSLRAAAGGVPGGSRADPRPRRRVRRARR